MKKKLLKERLQQLAGIKPLYSLNEQTNPFSGGTGPNWQAASQAWQSWNATNQGGAPQPDQTFLNNMQNRNCNFYENRLTAQVNSFMSQFGTAFGDPNQSTNPAWQSQKYARIMWLADKVRVDCSGGTAPNVQCFNDFIDDPGNEAVLTAAVCPNGSTAFTQQHLSQMKFRHKSISDCGMLEDKISEIQAQMVGAQGCTLVRKQAKHDYLTSLESHCCTIR